jgi:CBS domain-containing protein
VRLHEIMTSSVVTAPASAPARELAMLMRDRNVGSVVVVDDSGRPCGIVTDRDLTLDVLAGSHTQDTGAHELATSPVVTGEPEMELEEAAGLMVDHRIRRLPVVDGGQLVGIVTLDDIAVRTGNLEVARQMTADVARAVVPDFYFHQRGG